MRVPAYTSSPSRETMPATAPHPQGGSYLLRDSHIANNPGDMALDGCITSADEFHTPGCFYLPEIVSPSEILDSRFVSMARTQRAICLEEPSPELLSINNSACQPTATEVVRTPFFVTPFTSHVPLSNTSTAFPPRSRPTYHTTPG